MKKKKSKKAATDFAAELDEMDAENEEAAMANGDDGDLGDDVFDKPNGEAETGKEAWILEGRDPTYPEVSRTSRISSYSLIRQSRCYIRQGLLGKVLMVSRSVVIPLLHPPSRS